MRPASVGFQCPACVAEGAKTVREPRTVFGGRVTGATSTISLTLVGLNVFVYVLGLLVGQDALRVRFGDIPGPAPAELFGLTGGAVGVATGELYRLITSAFLHAGVIHLLLNMGALATVGPHLEAALGRVRFVALYLLSALGGSVAGFLLAPPATLSVGASGAVFGLFGAYYVVERRTGRDTASVLGLLAVNLVITFVLPFIDWRAHLGGLVTGTLIAAVLAYVPRGPRRTSLQAAGCVLLALVLVVLTVLRYRALGG